MKRKGLKYLIFIVALCIAKTPFNVFANSESSAREQSIVDNSDYRETLLEGKIGPWDPNNNGFEAYEDNELNGTRPGEGDCIVRTISVTVPLQMEFMVLPHSTLAFGSFFSPAYTITNNGEENLVARVTSFESNTIQNGENETQLHIEKVQSGDGRTQMELKLCTIDSINSNTVFKEIDLIGVEKLPENERELFELTANEFKRIKFGSDRWELPEYESKKPIAASNYTINFEFSIKE